jgi:uncharacterized phage protein (TIGR01671 family)
MTREIKFRALNSKNEIIYGLPYTDGVNETLYYKEFNNRLCWRDDKGRHCNQPYKNGTLQQYTGLHDKDGKEIYEGDIVEWDDESNGAYWRVAIVEIKPDLQFRIIKNTRHELSAEEGCIFHFGNFAYTNTEKYLRKIGNIYENKELLYKII